MLHYLYSLITPYYIGKLRNSYIALSAMAHNYRTQNTPNADPAQFSRSVIIESWLMNTSSNFEVRHLRKDAILCVEVIMSVSSEGFVRKQNRQVQDMRESQ